MTNSIKTDVIKSLTLISYYWLEEENYQSSYSIIQLIKELTLTKKQYDMVEDLLHDFNVMSKNKYDKKFYQKITIPDEFSDEDKKILWISGVCIMNLFASGNFELAYTHLMEMSLNWNELYTFVINNIKKQAFANEVAEWLFTHFLMAVDLLGKDDIEMLGYKVTKITEGK